MNLHPPPVKVPQGLGFGPFFSALLTAVYRMFFAVKEYSEGTVYLEATTTDATATELLVGGDRVKVPTDSTAFYRVSVCARRTDADNESAGYTIEGVIDNNAGTTALVGSQVTTVTVEDTAAWSVAVTADDTNDAIAVKATGEASKTIKWVARIDLTRASG